MPVPQADDISLIQNPSTRYQGSKLKIVDWIWSCISDLRCETFLDAMGGTASVAFAAKKHGKQVVYNDLLKANYYLGLALIENSSSTLNEHDIRFLLTRHKGLKYDSFIEDTFRNIYYLDDENAWLDLVIGNIRSLSDIYKRALALAALFQSCIVKRPYNLFHRANLYMRTADVKRGFGNKVTWDTPFEDHLKKFIAEYNSCVFSNGKRNKALNLDIKEIPSSQKYDLIYIDPPYFSKVRGELDYHFFYHFLEGLCLYLEDGPEKWKMQIDFKRKPRPLRKMNSIWTDKRTIRSAFDRVFKKFSSSIIVVSYNSEGIPSESEIVDMLKHYKDDVVVHRTAYQYALSPNHQPEELLFIAK